MTTKNNKRKIAYITGTRADYGRMIKTLKEMEANPELELSIIVTGMHLSHEFGYTVKEVEKDFSISKKCHMLLSGDTNSSMVQSFGLALIELTQALEDINPDILLVLGDRNEMFAGAIVAAHLNIAVAHVGGGHTTGGSTIDESIRHSITKFSNIHFVANKAHAKRLRYMGENPKNIFVVGAPDLDAILNLKLTPPKIIAKKYDLDLSEPILLFIQHPITTATSSENNINFKISMEVIAKLEYQTIVIYPNSDASGRGEIEIIKKFEHYPFIKCYQNIGYEDFLSLMAVSSAMIGNSSSGIIEAPSFKLPVVNIGSRQLYRDRAINVIDVDHNFEDIWNAINYAISDEFKENIQNCKNPYGDGNTYKKIAKILSEINLSPEFLRKVWSDVNV